MKNKVWTCKDGRELKIRDMTDAHLINAVKYYLRNGSIGYNCSGDVWDVDSLYCEPIDLNENEEFTDLLEEVFLRLLKKS